MEFVYLTYKQALRYKSMKEIDRTKDRGKSLAVEQDKIEETNHETCGTSCRFFLSTSKIISKAIKIDTM